MEPIERLEAEVKDLRRRVESAESALQEAALAMQALATAADQAFMRAQQAHTYIDALTGKPEIERVREAMDAALGVPRSAASAGPFPDDGRTLDAYEVRCRRCEGPGPDPATGVCWGCENS